MLSEGLVLLDSGLTILQSRFDFFLAGATLFLHETVFKELFEAQSVRIGGGAEEGC